jgi:phytoene desaturase
VLPDDFSLYLHRPHRHRSRAGPAGCDSFYVLSPVPNLDARVDWFAQAEPYRARIEAALARTLLPGLSDCIVTSRLVTPRHFRDELLSERGAGFGLEPLLTQSAYFRPHNQSEEVRGLFLVGAGTHPGAGVPGRALLRAGLDRIVPDAA